MNSLVKVFIISLCLFATELRADTDLEQSTALPCETNNSDCTFVLLTSDGTLKLHNERRAHQAFSPFSTFKIPNSLIALDLGIAKDLFQHFRADTNKYPPANWWPKIWTSQPHHLPSAFKYSVVPIYQYLAVQIGSQDMQRYLDAFNYGNKNISGGIDLFWLASSLKISPIEQVQFLKNLFEHKLPLTPKTYQLLKPLMLKDSHSEYQVYAKTGGGTLAKNGGLGDSFSQGWLVGVVERKNKLFYFAAHTQADTFKQVQNKRMDVAQAYLKHYQLAYY